MGLQRFYWLVPDRLAGCSRPGSRAGAHSEDAAALRKDLAWLTGQGIGAVLTLTETALAPDALAASRLEALHLPIPDLAPPLPGEFEQALDFIDRHLSGGRRVAVHCLAGQGRTGSILCAYLIRGGLEPEDALSYLRAICPGAVENERQEAALRDFATRRPWLL